MDPDRCTFCGHTIADDKPYFAQQKPGGPLLVFDTERCFGEWNWHWTGEGFEHVCVEDEEVG